MNGNDLELHLDEEFLSLLKLSADILESLGEQFVARNMYHEWLRKLATDPCNGVQMKHERNTSLGTLLVGIKYGQLTSPFHESPKEIGSENGQHSIDQPKCEFSTGDNDESYGGDLSTVGGSATHIATKTMENGLGACTYLAIAKPGVGQNESNWFYRNSHKPA